MLIWIILLSLAPKRNLQVQQLTVFGFNSLMSVCSFPSGFDALTEGAAGQLSICHQALPYSLRCSFPHAMLSPLKVRWHPFTSVLIHARGETPSTTSGQKHHLLRLLTSGKWSLAGGQQRRSVHNWVPNFMLRSSILLRQCPEGQASDGWLHCWYVLSLRRGNNLWAH